MKLNIANPARGLQKCIAISKPTEMKLCELKINDIFAGEIISPEFKNYTLKIRGGDDLQGFPMKERVMIPGRTKLLLKKGEKGYRCKRKGMRKRKSVRGCFITQDISVVSCVICSEGETVIPGLSDSVVDRSHLPKREDKLREMFNIPKGVDLLKAVQDIVNSTPVVEGKKRKLPRIAITRLVTPEMIKKKQEEIEKRKTKKVKSENERREYEKKFGKIE